MADRELKQVLIPDVLVGERVDSALSKLLGLSRTLIIDLIEAGDITKKSKRITKSQKVELGDHFEVLLPEVKVKGEIGRAHV